MLPGRERLAGIAIGAAVSFALVHAALQAWLSDDAFVSFRYARNLVEGHGLVFNPGERVEGYTNPLWTLWIALGMRLGASPERWSIVSGIACYGGAIALLGRAHVRACRAIGVPDWMYALPIGALAGAADPDWATFATSGLETSAFTFFSLAAALLALAPSPRRAAFSGGLFALAALTRPDGALFTAVAFAFLLAGRAFRPALVLAAVFALVWAPFTAWRIAYYGSFFPNTYYAKSGDLAWWSQGLFYVRLYFERHWIFLLGPIGLLALGRRVRPLATAALFVVTLAFAYTAYIARVGGDFMFGRMLVPTAPLFLLLVDFAATLALLPLRLVAPAIALACFAGPLLTPLPLRGGDANRGILDEHAHYTQERMDRTRARARVIAPFFEGLPAVVAIYGDEAALAYYARIPVAIEAHAGLTDAFVARQPLARRGRVGHEKHAPLDYLVRVRGAQLTFSKVPTLDQGLDDYVPPMHADLGGVRARLLTWDPAFVEAIRARGAHVDDFPAWLDGLIQRLPELSDAQVRDELTRCRRFYFDRVRDPRREAAFAERLSQGPRGGDWTGQGGGAKSGR
ncbi:MAG TPA: hypothetical protein VGI39_02730 [Polyangiaceae bacterium]